MRIQQAWNLHDLCQLQDSDIMVCGFMVWHQSLANDHTSCCHMTMIKSGSLPSGVYPVRRLLRLLRRHPISQMSTKGYTPSVDEHNNVLPGTSWALQCTSNKPEEHCNVLPVSQKSTAMYFQYARRALQCTSNKPEEHSNVLPISQKSTAMYFQCQMSSSMHYQQLEQAKWALQYILSLMSTTALQCATRRTVILMYSYQLARWALQRAITRTTLCYKSTTTKYNVLQMSMITYSKSARLHYNVQQMPRNKTVPPWKVSAGLSVTGLPTTLVEAVDHD